MFVARQARANCVHMHNQNWSSAVPDDSTQEPLICDCKVVHRAFIKLSRSELQVVVPHIRLRHGAARQILQTSRRRHQVQCARIGWSRVIRDAAKAMHEARLARCFFVCPAIVPVRSACPSASGARKTALPERGRSRRLRRPPNADKFDRVVLLSSDRCCATQRPWESV